MNLSEIRSMTDEDLRAYLKSLSDRRSTNCVKCGKMHAEYIINVQNKNKFQQKKLCSLCKDCYENMLKDLNVCDIIWE